MLTVLYVLAAIGLVTVLVLAWMAFGPQRPAARDRRAVGPDDDPDFLRRLGRQRTDEDDTG